MLMAVSLVAAAVVVALGEAAALVAVVALEAAGEVEVSTLIMGARVVRPESRAIKVDTIYGFSVTIHSRQLPDLY
tara:strand:- start:731 stop:955 length:225 start_codon:yes stop_codon:yes gene_type:complete